MNMHVKRVDYLYNSINLERKSSQILKMDYSKSNIGDTPTKRKKIRMVLFYLLQENIFLQLHVV